MKLDGMAGVSWKKDAIASHVLQSQLLIGRWEHWAGAWVEEICEEGAPFPLELPIAPLSSLGWALERSFDHKDPKLIALMGVFPLTFRALEQTLRAGVAMCNGIRWTRIIILCLCFSP